MGYFDELEKNIVHYLRISEIKNKSKNKKKKREQTNSLERSSVGIVTPFFTRSF